MLVLEELEHARRRGAPIYAEVKAYRTCNSAYHLLYPEPNGLGLIRTTREALREAEMTPADVDLVAAQGCSLLDYDRMESRCIQESFGEHRPRVSAITSFIGNPLGGLGAFQGAVSALALKHQTYPPHANADSPDTVYPIRLAARQAEPGPLRAVVQNSYCFMAKHSTLVYSRWEEN